MKIIGAMVCGPGEADRWLEDSLKDFKRLCDNAVIVTCNATPKEKILIKKYGYWCYEDNREWGKYQDQIKTDLLERICRLRANWCLSLDADETVPTVTREILEGLTTSRISTYFYVVNLIDSEETYSKPLSFWNVRFYQAPSPGNRRFQRTPLHCGSAPPIAWRQSPKDSYVPHILIHKGLMLQSDRLKKAERYKLYDPEAKYKGRDYYDALVAEIKPQEYTQSEVLKEITAFCHDL